MSSKYWSDKDLKDALMLLDAARLSHEAQVRGDLETAARLEYSEIPGLLAGASAGAAQVLVDAIYGWAQRTGMRASDVWLGVADTLREEALRREQASRAGDPAQEQAGRDP